MSEEEKKESKPEEVSSEEKKEENSDKKSEKKCEIESLKEELKVCNERLLRTAAEYENFRKRSEKEKEAIYQDAVSFAVLSILPVADSLDAATESLESQPDEVKKGINLIKSQFSKALEVLEIKPFGEIGDKFDPSIHSAISHVEDETERESEISKVFQKGYKSKTRIIRHAMVQVIN